MLKFCNSYSELGDAFYQRIAPTPVSQPRLLLWNDALADQLQLDPTLCADNELRAQYFSGNQLAPGCEPLALAYCGHQFGHLSPQLGDGRAHLLGELIDSKQQRVDIQLKGSGPTAFSRNGDGRCALGPALREYIMSEALHALGVPSSRCLAVVSSGDHIYRDRRLPGAIVTRVAASHIRVGSFQYFAIRGDLDSLQRLLDYTIQRHFPDLDQALGDKQRADENANRTLRFLQAVIARQIQLVVAWMRVGFIHGVMNTDNTAVSGETIDFGPCAMLGRYHPATAYSSIDTQGRYAFGNQANIALWNMARLAESLLALIDSAESAAINRLQTLFEHAQQQFEQQYYHMMGRKLGIDALPANEQTLVDSLLARLRDQQLDYTLTFAGLTQSLQQPAKAAALSAQLGDCYQRWRQFLRAHHIGEREAQALMTRENPLVIPRNHHVEALLRASEESLDVAAIERFLAVLRQPYTQQTNTAEYQDAPGDGDQNYRTFCGT